MDQTPFWRIREWFRSNNELDERAYERLRIFHVELLRWTQKINLISAGTAREADRVHFADGILGSLIISKNLGSHRQVYDIGSGNGVPGVIFSILRPDIGVICIDSDERKTSFIKQLSLRLELDNLAARATRVEKLDPESISCAIARGFAPLDKSLRLVGPALGKEGAFFHFKGHEWSTELASVPVWGSSTWNTTLVETYDLPVVGALVAGVKPETRVILKSLKLK
jgi:16S rRNA (guanine527-N7)-methyltransferase